MKSVKTLVLGAGISGLSFAHFRSQLDDEEVIVLEKEAVPGGYCRTFEVNGFRFDCSGHFLHFKDPEMKKKIQSFLGDGLLSVQKRTSIHYGPNRIDFPFQKNIHQLPQDEFIECLIGLFEEKPKQTATNFKEMLISRYGSGICNKFLFPYNEKLYACDLSTLEVEAMGRFFPHADPIEIVRSFRKSNSASYNSDFLYPKQGVSSLVNAFSSRMGKIPLQLQETVLKIDPAKNIVTTDRDQYQYENLVSTVPLNKFLPLIGESSSELSYNKVLVFNFGFDGPTRVKDHWIYFPDQAVSFYRVGFYNNILGSKQMSLYVELGFPPKENIDISYWREKILEDLKRTGLLEGQKVIAENSVLMDPAYCHITRASEVKTQRLTTELKNQNIHLLGRYAQWIYCSIEDNILGAKQLAEKILRAP